MLVHTSDDQSHCTFVILTVVCLQQCGCVFCVGVFCYKKYALYINSIYILIITCYNQKWHDLNSKNRAVVQNVGDSVNLAGSHLSDVDSN